MPFGRNKVYSGLVKQVHTTAPVKFQARYLQDLLDDTPIVTRQQFEFWEWMASYYMCNLGEVMQAALPPAMKLAGETRIAMHPLAGQSNELVTEREAAILEALEENKQLKLSQVATLISTQKVMPIIKTMMDKGLLIIREELDNPWRAKLKKFMVLSQEFLDQEAMKTLFDQLESRAPKQLEVLMQYLNCCGALHLAKEVEVAGVTNPVKGGMAALSSLVKKEVFSIVEKPVSHFEHLEASAEEVELNPHQKKAMEEIREGFQNRDVALLHGVTSSGKTELYMDLIQETINKGQQVLYLLPEIALTTQIIDRLQKRFGRRAGIYHSRFNPMERTEVWNNLLHGGVQSGEEIISYDLVLGPRSAVFLPFQRLGLIIIDEEHEPSFKQFDPAPRYHARDSAIYLASMHGAKVLLGSATPSLEVYVQAKSGKFALANIHHRHGEVKMPEIRIADLRKENRQRTMQSHFSPLLLESMKNALDTGKQIILFQNRRGFSPRQECDVCHWLPHCHCCDVSLVYHKKDGKLKCHYCGFSTSPVGECPSCGSTAIKMKGFGTEKIEEELPLYFPKARVGRMDLDTTRSKNAYRKIIEDFQEKRMDILVGTQMVTKGLDFNNVGVVGILNADNMLSFPDFRSHERAYQLMAQVSGRAGRRKGQGLVIIQTHKPDHPIIAQVVDNNYLEMVRLQLAERKNFHYPPFTRLVEVTAMHPDQDLLNEAAEALSRVLKRAFPGQVLGPEYPLVSRIKNQYMKRFLIKLKKSPALGGEKSRLGEIAEEFLRDRKWKPVRLVFNVDPQ